MGELKGIDGLKNQVQECIQYAYDKGVKAGQKEAIEEIKQKWIEQGRNEAWEWCGKYIPSKEDGGEVPVADLQEIFDVKHFKEIFDRYTYQEAVEKIRVYEEQKNAEEEEIKVGDEVYSDTFCDKGIVTHITGDKTECVAIICSGSSMMKAKRNGLHKTGRTFPQIAEVLEKMKEGE